MLKSFVLAVTALATSSAMASTYECRNSKYSVSFGDHVAYVSARDSAPEVYAYTYFASSAEQEVYTYARRGSRMALHVNSDGAYVRLTKKHEAPSYLPCARAP